jgi:hypothetical protein
MDLDFLQNVEKLSIPQDVGVQLPCATRDPHDNVLAIDRHLHVYEPKVVIF